jgi:hypothetical protein
MCLIVDANLAGLVFASPAEADFVPILDWLLEKDGRLVFGGHLGTELDRVERARRFLRALLQAGRAIRIPDEAVQEEEAVVRNTGHCQSNDSHVVALARVSGARTLCTHDRDLQQDFSNPKLVSNPRGKIYQRREHHRLLRHTPGCRWRTRGA